ncbi:hypothetical protein AGMMS49941_11880 [Deferribacterales bacterium]|nr:hypothetical protein AGMMS49941_11880 [Deferribacterales bacterium]
MLKNQDKLDYKMPSMPVGTIFAVCVCVAHTLHQIPLKSINLGIVKNI